MQSAGEGVGRGDDFEREHEEDHEPAASNGEASDDDYHRRRKRRADEMDPESGDRDVKRQTTGKNEIYFRLLCPSSKSGNVIGKVGLEPTLGGLLLFSCRSRPMAASNTAHVIAGVYIFVRRATEARRSISRELRAVRSSKS